MNWISAKNTNTEFEKDVEFRRKSYNSQESGNERCCGKMLQTRHQCYNLLEMRKEIQRRRQVSSLRALITQFQKKIIYLLNH
jgi:hypothetical protein